MTARKKQQKESRVDLKDRLWSKLQIKTTRTFKITNLKKNTRTKKWTQTQTTSKRNKNRKEMSNSARRATSMMNKQIINQFTRLLWM